MDVAESKNGPLMFSALLHEQKAHEVTWERNLILLQVGHNISKTSVPFATSFLPRTGCQNAVAVSVVSDERRLLSCNRHAATKITLHIENIYKDPSYKGQRLGNENCCHYV